MRALIAFTSLVVATSPAVAQTFWEIDGQPADQLVRLTLGDVIVAKAQRQVNDDNKDVANKVNVPGMPLYPVNVRVSWNMADPVVGWINESMRLMKGRHVRAYENSSRGTMVYEQQEWFLDSVEFPGGDSTQKKLDPSPKNNPGMAIRARGIITKKPGSGSPSSTTQKTWTPSNFKLTLRDAQSDPVDVPVQRFLPIKFRVAHDRDSDGTPDQATASIDDLVLTVPATSYDYFADWFAKVLAVAPVLDPIDNGDYLKRTMDVAYILDDGSAVVLTLTGVMPLSIQPAGSSFEVILAAERIEVIQNSPSG